MSDNFEELDGEIKKECCQDSKRAIIDIKDDWPWWQRFVASFINSIPVFLWCGITYLLIMMFGSNVELVGFRNAYLNVIVPAAAYGILTLVAGLTLVSWLFPYFNYRRLMREGSDVEKATCMVFWGAIALALSIIIAGAM
jgi:hypothetical protein